MHYFLFYSIMVLLLVVVVVLFSMIMMKSIKWNLLNFHIKMCLFVSFDLSALTESLILQTHLTHFFMFLLNFRLIKELTLQL